MGQTSQTITVFGGTGFLGRRAVRCLVAHGFRVRVASRHPGRAPPLFMGGETGVTEIEADIRDERQIVAALAGADGAVNAVGLYIERGSDTFRSVHVEAAARLARLCREHGLRRLIHVSGIGADPHDTSAYIRARGEGERAVAKEFPAVTILRPTVMFALDDAFLTTLVRLGRILPVFPLFGWGDTRLQPAFVEDVAEAIARLAAELKPAGAIYELGGPDAYTYRDLLVAVVRHLRLRRVFLPLPYFVWTLMATVAEHVPGAGLTRNQVELMKRDTVVSGRFPGFADLQIEPTPIENVLTEIIDLPPHSLS